MKILIVDDQIVYQNQIRKLICSIREDSIIDTYSSCEAVPFETYQDYDIIFLDIVMTGENGVQLASRIRKENKHSIIFFISSHTSYISNAMQQQPFQYITKPIDEELFLSEFERAMQEFSNRRQKLTLTWNKENYFVEISDIEYIENINRNSNIYTGNIEYICSENIPSLYSKLNEFGFVRTHNSFLVNIKKIASIKAYNLIMLNGKSIPISKKYIHIVKKAFLNYISGSCI